MTNYKLIIIVFSFLYLGSCGIHNKSYSKNKNWLEGTWTGIAFQIDLSEDNQWTIELDIDIEKETYNISYPSLNCSGNWKLIKYSEDQATFMEVIKNNTSVCIEHGIIILSKIDNERVLYSYFYNDGVNSDGKKATAFSTLEKNK
ncbi:hypothetical protein [uncultured Aquimarina sp.]|uniref:hypothetical protein n=1 Tax=uncultured Aquimarina sp. TaxID=575652 RepID=UPI002610C44F|nr:hypothetical protein [uncultured Aquimarina sp.]